VATAMAEANPTLARRELAVYFNNLREQRGRSLDELASLIGVTASQASRLDTGARGFQLSDVEKLADWYELGRGETERVLAIATEARKRSWWQQIDLPSSYRTLIGLERGAEAISEFCSTVVPGLLQTPEYTEAAVRASQLGIGDDEVAQVVHVRMRRQEILDRAAPPDVSVVLDEAALARGAHGPNVMRGQLQHLLDLAKRPEISIQILPFSAGLYPGVGQFILLKMPRSIPDVYYTETQISWRDTSDGGAVREAGRLWRTLQATALGQELSARRIADYRDQY
jgi:transcriptional regulator with XRE-family HTH domain